MCFSDVLFCSFFSWASGLAPFAFLWMGGDDSDEGDPHKCEWLLCLNNCVVLLLLLPLLLLLLLLFFFRLTTCWRCTQSFSLTECGRWNTPNLRCLISTCIHIWEMKSQKVRKKREKGWKCVREKWRKLFASGIKLSNWFSPGLVNSLELPLCSFQL